MSAYTREVPAEIGGWKTVKPGHIRVGASLVVSALVLAAFISQAAVGLASQERASGLQAGAVTAAGGGQASGQTVKRGTRPTKSIQPVRAAVLKPASASIQASTAAA